MIGNLFNTVAITIMSGLFALGGVTPTHDQINNAIDDLGQVTSHITGESVDLYASFNLRSTYSSTLPAINTMKLYSFDLYNNYTALSQLYDYGAEDAANLPASTNYLTLCDKIWNEWAANTNYLVVHFNRYSPSSGVLEYCFCLPANTPVKNIELAFTANLEAAPTCQLYHYSKNVLSYPAYEAYHTKVTANWLCVSNDIGYAYSESLTPTSQDSSVDAFAFSCYVYRVFLTSDMVLNFQANLLADVNNQYYAGYTNGYQIGASDGYRDGYANGMSTSQNFGGFSNLFANIADTPLRFLYGLFNFDLFGISMLVIIMSLITGFIVIGIAKKVIK